MFHSELAFNQIWSRAAHERFQAVAKLVHKQDLTKGSRNALAAFQYILLLLKQRTQTGQYILKVEAPEKHPNIFAGVLRIARIG